LIVDNKPIWLSNYRIEDRVKVEIENELENFVPTSANTLSGNNNATLWGTILTLQNQVNQLQAELQQIRGIVTGQNLSDSATTIPPLKKEPVKPKRKDKKGSPMGSPMASSMVSPEHPAPHVSKKSKSFDITLQKLSTIKAGTDTIEDPPHVVSLFGNPSDGAKVLSSVSPPQTRKGVVPLVKEEEKEGLPAHIVSIFGSKNDRQKVLSQPKPGSHPDLIAKN